MSESVTFVHPKRLTEMDRKRVWERERERESRGTNNKTAAWMIT